MDEYMENLISIVMPVYNGSRYLRESIESILNQSFTNWELIMVNDCSTDSSLEIMQEYAERDSRITVYSNKQNMKLPSSLNIGFQYAKGKYFTWTSDDNLYEKNALWEMYACLEENEEIGLVYCDMWNIDEEGNILSETHNEPQQLYYENCIGACFLYRSKIA